MKCKKQLFGFFEHFVSRKAMNIEGLGYKINKTLINLGYMKSAADLFRLKKYESELKSLEGFGEKSIENLFFPSPDRLIEINDIGEVVAKNISIFFSDKKVIKKIKTMQDLGVNISHEEQISSSNEFQEMSFVITGKFSKFSRNELKSQREVRFLGLFHLKQIIWS